MKTLTRIYADFKLPTVKLRSENVSKTDCQTEKEKRIVYHRKKNTRTGVKLLDMSF